MNEEETNANKRTCTNVLELNIPNNPIPRVNTLQMAMDQVDRKGKKPEVVTCSDNEEKGLDYQVQTNSDHEDDP